MGVRIIHVHWTYPFALHWASRHWQKRILRYWFSFWVVAVNALGMNVVWTAHNLLPNEPVFDNDAFARRMLVRHSAGVIAHDFHTSSELREQFGARDVHVIPQGAIHLPVVTRTVARRACGIDDDHLLVVAAIGRIVPYKGIDVLLSGIIASVHQDPELGGRIGLLVAGECRDLALERKLHLLSERMLNSGIRTVLNLKYLSDWELAASHAAADVVVLPYRRVTNSGALATALSCGVPVIATDLPSIRTIGDGAVIRIGFGPEEIARGIQEFDQLSAEQRANMRLKGLAWASDASWELVAKSTKAVYEIALGTSIR
jgi:glycosyltransferase involved in cell wall biosynthesis